MKRKKTIILLLTFILLSGSRVLAFSDKGLSGGINHFSLDLRDSQNRKIESEIIFRDTVFTRVYSQISPFGIVKKVSPPSEPQKILPDFSLDLPRAMFSVFYGNKEIFLKMTEKSSYPMSAVNIILTASFLGAFMILLCVKLQTNDEPRFRVPVFLE
ncbi:MAG: hypothetical protein ACQESB_04250 [Elusimicrobiota bacterium]